MYMYIYIYIYTRTHTQTHTCLHACEYVCVTINYSPPKSPSLVLFAGILRRACFRRKRLRDCGCFARTHAFPIEQ